MSRKGIILAGGNATRLYPITKVISKQLLPVYDKPMIYYPLSTLMSADIREILIITTERDIDIFKSLLGDGSNYGIEIQYEVQKSPNGIAEAFIIGENFIKDTNTALILGDNIFCGFEKEFFDISLKKEEGAYIFAYPVSDPERYGNVNFSDDGYVIEIIEKPKKPLSKYATTGLYFYDETVVEKSKELKISDRGELEITDLNNKYLKEGKLFVKKIDCNATWLDAGTIDSLNEASSYIQTIEKRQGQKIGLPEEISWRKGWINDYQLGEIAKGLIKSGYGSYLINLMKFKKR